MPGQLEGEFGRQQNGLRRALAQGLLLTGESQKSFFVAEQRKGFTSDRISKSVQVFELHLWCQPGATAPFKGYLAMSGDIWLSQLGGATAVS